jgi:hypothetical protein
MTKAVADILRRSRVSALNRADAYDAESAYHEKEAAQMRIAAQEARYLHCQLGAAIQILEGDYAILDLPDTSGQAQPSAEI